MISLRNKKLSLDLLLILVWSSEEPSLKKKKKNTSCQVSVYQKSELEKRLGFRVIPRYIFLFLKENTYFNPSLEPSR